METHDIIVIGAGVAGLAAASVLKKAGRRVVVIEAQGYIGGRIKTDRSRDTVELGAEFVHGEHAVTWEIIRAKSLAAEEWAFRGNSDYRVYGEDGEIRPDSAEMMSAMYAAEKGLEKCDDTSLSVADYVDAQDVSEEIRFYSKRHIGDVEGADPALLSAAALAEAERLATNGEKNFRVLDGYDRIPQALAEDLEIHTEHAASHIAWGPQKVSVQCANGRIFSARQVVVTVSLGVMQRGGIPFSPGLPPEFLDATTRIGYGDNCKCIFWIADSMPEFRMIDTKGAFGHFWQQRKGGMTIVTGYSGGPRATELTRMGKEKAIETGIEDLTSALGNKVRACIRHAEFCSWSDNPFILGSYSYPKMGMGNARTIIRKSIENTIYYAGEATNTKGHASTVHGAIEEGYDVAWRILGTS